MFEELGSHFCEPLPQVVRARAPRSLYAQSASKGEQLTLKIVCDLELRALSLVSWALARFCSGTRAVPPKP